MASGVFRRVELVAADLLKGMLDEYGHAEGQVITDVVMAVSQDASSHQTRVCDESLMHSSLDTRCRADKRLCTECAGDD